VEHEIAMSRTINVHLRRKKAHSMAGITVEAAL